MTSLYIVAPQAARDLLVIRRYLRQQAGRRTADRVEAFIRSKFTHLAQYPESGHWRPDLTSTPVRFLAVYSYLIVYLPTPSPLQIVSIVHGNRDVAALLSGRFLAGP